MGFGMKQNKIKNLVSPLAKLIKKYRNSNFSAIPNGEGDTPKTFSDWEEMAGTHSAILWIKSRKKWRRKH